jgi:hypothetical protein
MLELTEKQRQAIRQGEAVLMADPELGEEVVLLRAELYETIRELLEDEREKAGWAKLAAASRAGWARENPYGP